MVTIVFNSTVFAVHPSNSVMPALVAHLDGRLTGDQEVAGSINPRQVGNILLWRLIMKYFLWSFSPFSWFKKGNC